MIDKSKMGLQDFSKYRSELMGIAIISIMFFHYCENVLAHYSSGIHYTVAYWYNMFIGSIGVEIFLFLSGMGLYFSLRKGGTNDIYVFYKKRFSRVLVPYLIYASVAWFIIDVVLQDLGIGFFIYDLSTLGFWFGGSKTIWFIAFIIVMYMAFPFIYRILECQERRHLKIVILMVCVVFVLECFRVADSESYSNISIALTRIPIFILGAYFGKKIYEKEPISLLQYVLFISGIIAGFANFYLEYMNDTGRADEGVIKILYLYFHHFDRYINAWYSLGVMFAAIFVLRIIGKACQPLSKLLSVAGTLSLELYMTHVTIRKMFEVAELPIWLFAYFGTVIIISVFMSVALNRIDGLVQSKVLRN